MAPNTNSNIANDALLDVLLKHPDFSAFERKGGAECFPKENVAQICADYTSNTNQGLRYSLHCLQEPAPNCRSLLRDGGQTLYRVGDNESPTRHFKSFADLAIGSLAFPITDFCVQFSIAESLLISEVANYAIRKGEL